MKSNVNATIKTRYQLDETSYNAIVDYTMNSSRKRYRNLMNRMVRKYFDDKKRIKGLKNTLRESNLSKTGIMEVLKLIKNEISLNNKIERLQTMQRLFKYWHIAHLPFALIMLVIMVIHVGITLAFGARWIF